MGALLFIDLDRFKNINDSLGHPVGDNVLKQAGRRIAAAVRVGDVVARLGGDEFVVVAPGVRDAESARDIALKIQQALQSAIKVQQRELFATPSIGISLFPRDGTTTNVLLRNADTAMYQAKAAGRNAVRFFDPAMAVAAQLYLTTESNLRNAVVRGELEPYYQPLVRLDDGRLEALELLARWHHPQQGVVSPSQFIPVAEEAGLVASIGLFLLDAACMQLGHWDRNGLSVPRLAVNLSATQFRDPALAASLLEAVRRTGIAPSRIELEITEGALAQEGEQTLETLRALVAAGFSIAVDDFGTGYSSLAYLRRFPVAKLKIDRSFIQHMTEEPNDEAIVRTVIALARTLKLTTVAEGVETEAQRDALRRMGCDLAQGYLFGRPMTAAQFVRASLGLSTAAT
jgi:diguanylate cyclase (GGDEF)-like protein